MKILRIIAGSLALNQVGTLALNQVVTHQKNAPMPNQTLRVAVDGAVEHEKRSMENTAIFGDMRSEMLGITSNLDFLTVSAKDKNTELHTAVYNGLKDTVEALVIAGVDIDFTDEFGRTALNLATEYGYVEIIELLLDSGANVNNIAQLNLSANKFID